MTELAPNGLPARLREGIDPYDGIREAEAVMDAAADELDRLRAEVEECREHLMTVLYYCPGGFPKAEAYLNRTQKEGE